MSVHFLVHQPEDDGLVPDQSLVVTLRIRNVLLSVASVHEGVADILDIPIFVLHGLEKLDGDKQGYKNSFGAL